MSNKYITKYSFTMPKVGYTALLSFKCPMNLIDGSWLWNPSVGYLEVDESNGTDTIIVTNIGRVENAKEGAEFPSCMEFLEVAPDSVPLYDTTVTCLTADFISPSVGNTGIMVVEDTSNIRENDILIIDRQYRYLVVQILDEHRLLVSNEGDGKEGIIKTECGKCVSVKILESTACCQVVREELQAEIDDINDKLNTKKSIIPGTGNNLVTISGGANALTNAQYDTVISVNNDLSNYDNSNTKFITINDVPPVPTGNLTSSNNKLTISGGTGATLQDVSLTVSNGNLSSNTNVLTVTNGTGATFQNTSLTLDTDLSKYNNSNSKFITAADIPVIPTVPNQYSGYTDGANLMRSVYNISINYTLENTATTGSPTSETKTITEFPTITLASPNTNGKNITIVGNVFVSVEGTYHCDTHTYPDGGWHSLVTARGPTTEITVMPKLNNVNMYSSPVSSGKSFHLVLDKLGTTASPRQYFSDKVSVPIVCEINPSTSNTISFTGKIEAGGLRNSGGSSANNDTFYNEDVNVKALNLHIVVALAWVLK